MLMLVMQHGMKPISYFKKCTNIWYTYSAPSRAALYTGRFATRFGFEFTPTPKIFGMILSQASRKNIHQPTFHHENLAVIPGMRDMVYMTSTQICFF